MTYKRSMIFLFVLVVCFVGVTSLLCERTLRILRSEGISMWDAAKRWPRKVISQQSSGIRRVQGIGFGDNLYLVASGLNKILPLLRKDSLGNLSERVGQFEYVSTQMTTDSIKYYVWKLVIGY